MLTLEYILKIIRRGDYNPPVCLDRHDSPEHRGSYNPDYSGKSGEKSVEVNLGYKESNGDVTIVQR